MKNNRNAQLIGCTQRNLLQFSHFIVCGTHHCTYINWETKTLQTLHKTLHFLRISLILRTLQCVGFEAKILHKPYMEPYMGTKSQRVKESKSQRDKETKRGRVGERKAKKNYGKGKKNYGKAKKN